MSSLDDDILIKYISKSNLYGTNVGSVVRFRVIDIINSSFGKMVTLEPVYFEGNLFTNS